MHRKKIEKEECKKQNYYKESVDALIKYMSIHEKNPNEKDWNKYAIEKRYLSSKSLGYLSGKGFNNFCRYIRKELNNLKRKD